MQRYAITDRALLPGGDWQGALSRQIADWAAAEVQWVQLREKDLSLPALTELAHRLATELRGAGTKLLVNGLSAARAKDCGADGVHLPGAANAEQIAEARALGRVTVSCHALSELGQAREVDAVLWSPVFGKMVRGEPIAPGSGLGLLRQACARVHPVPVFALGGVTALNAQACVEAGAAGVAGIRLFHGEGWRSL